MHRTTLFLLIASFLCFSIQAQQGQLNSKRFLDKYQMVTDFDQEVAPNEFFKTHQQAMGLSPLDEMKMINVQYEENGYTHQRFRQFHQGLKVYGAAYVLHSYKGKVVSANGHFLPKIEVDKTPNYNKFEAVKLARQAMSAEEYYPTPTELVELCIIDRAFPKISGDYALAYRMEVYSKNPEQAYMYYLDAHEGQVLASYSLYHQTGVPGKGVTKYYGERDIIVDSIAADEFVLHDPTRCSHGISVYDRDMNTFKSSSSSFDLTNENQDEVAVDALFCTSRMYDMLKEDYDWLGIDNMDGSMNVVVHAREGDYVNAYWDGRMAFFGDGDCNRGPLVTLEVLGHEFMHGITQNTSGLIYASESGAINESLSDVIGKALEYEVDPDEFNWLMGQSFIYSDQVESFRNMADPNTRNHPEMYKGDLWNDGAGVHTNSAVGNRWFVYLSDGGTGVNQAGDSFEVEGMGIEEAAQFIFYVNRNYLVESSGYHEYYEASILAAEIYFNNDQEIIENIKQAWRAVGLPTFQSSARFELGIQTQGYIPVCGFGDYFPITFTINNNGTEPYLASMNLSVNVNYDVNFENFNFDVPLDVDIQAGESAEFTIDSMLVLEDDFIFIDYILGIIDDNEGNNTAFDYVSVNPFSEDDMTIRATIEDLDCFNDEYALSLTLLNESCEWIPTGTELEILLVDEIGTQLWQAEIVTEFPVISNGGYRLDTTITLDIKERSFGEVILNYANDPNIANNSEPIELPKLNLLGSDYENSFDNSQFGSELRVSSNDFFGDNIYTLDGDNWFMTTGRRAEDPNPLCFLYEKNWDNSPLNFGSNVSARMELCVDLEGNEDPRLIFDINQFRNDEMEFASNTSSSLQVNWISDTESGNEIFESQEEGRTYRQDVNLPSEFKGRLDLRFLTQTGVSSAEFDFFNYDIVFLDNLRFNNSVDVVDLDEYEGLKIFPNPTSESLYLVEAQRFKSLSIYNLNGQLVKQLNRVDSKILVEDLQPGIYQIHAVDKEGSQFSQKFVRL